ncbi:CPBP family intramembrane glutamic endopeptidase [Salinibacter grassmerensis]|uniref:CPBP family intramembrane glutamic endopeptidase n=1 Tax=Salinibacter grassmerensis TaxID=3040353 RepID=UPI0021E78414|nr:CPBP family intramembrane glutamic endopeptidase [Salinibacter grassmerensis]
MENASEPIPNAQKRRATAFVWMGLLSEVALGLGGWGAGLWRGIDWGAQLRWAPDAVLWGVLAGCALVVLHLMLLRSGGTRNPLYRTIYRPLVRTLRPQLRGVRTLSLVLLALASGIGEEVLFRGWLQAEMGLVGASLLFGAAHVWGRDAVPYGLYAAGMGGLLGGLFTVTGSLWAPVLAHAVNNLLGFLALREGWFVPSAAEAGPGGDG